MRTILIFIALTIINKYLPETFEPSIIDRLLICAMVFDVASFFFKTSINYQLENIARNIKSLKDGISNNKTK